METNKKDGEWKWDLVMWTMVSLAIIGGFTVLGWLFTCDEKEESKIVDLERKLKVLECELKGGKLNKYYRETSFGSIEGYFEDGELDYCEKEGLRYYWKDGDWVNQETKILE